MKDFPRENGVYQMAEGVLNVTCWVSFNKMKINELDDVESDSQRDLRRLITGIIVDCDNPDRWWRSVSNIQRQTTISILLEWLCLQRRAAAQPKSGNRQLSSIGRIEKETIGSPFQECLDLIC